LQERGSVLEQQKLRAVQQEIKREEDSSVDEQQDNRKDTVRIHKATEEVSEICVNYLLLNI
jgi:hypothetical protein